MTFQFLSLKFVYFFCMLFHGHFQVDDPSFGESKIGLSPDEFCSRLFEFNLIALKRLFHRRALLLKNVELGPN